MLHEDIEPKEAIDVVAETSEAVLSEAHPEESAPEDDESIDDLEEEEAAEVDLAEEEARDGDENEAPVDNEGADGEPKAGFPNLEAAYKQRAPTCPLDLPFSVVRRIMKAAAPQKRFTPDLIAAFARGGGAFALFLLSACQESTETTGKTTIRPTDVINGLKACGFPELAEEVRVHLNITVVKPKKKKSTRRRK
jgi:histone H3/H4